MCDQINSEPGRSSVGANLVYLLVVSGVHTNGVESVPVSVPERSIINDTASTSVGTLPSTASSAA